MLMDRYGYVTDGGVLLELLEIGKDDPLNAEAWWMVKARGTLFLVCTGEVVRAEVWEIAKMWSRAHPPQQVGSHGLGRRTTFQGNVPECSNIPEQGVTV